MRSIPTNRPFTYIAEETRTKLGSPRVLNFNEMTGSTAIKKRILQLSKLEYFIFVLGIFYFYEVFFSQLIFLVSSHGKSRKVSISHLIIIISICGWEGCCQSGFLVADLIFKCLWIALETRRLLPTDQESSTEKLGRSKR